MENYFILLELPFDLPESDTNKISEAISKKQAQWSRDQSNPVKKAKASEYLAALEDIKKVMLDPTARKQEAAKAKQIKASKAKEVKVTHPKYGNHKVYAYEDGFVAGNKDAKEHGNIVDVFDSTKEYCRWLDLQILEKGGSITELKRQVPLTIQEAFQYEGKRIQKIDYRADFYYRDKNGTVVVEDVKGYDQKNGKYIQTEAFRLKWKLLKSKYPDYHFVLY